MTGRKLSFKVVSCLVFEDCTKNMCFMCGKVLFWVTENYIFKCLYRFIICTGWDTPIYKTFLIKVLIGNIQSTSISQIIFQCWVKTKSVTVVKITMIFQVFTEDIDSKGSIVIELHILIELSIDLSEGVNTST